MIVFLSIAVILLLIYAIIQSYLMRTLADQTLELYKMFSEHVKHHAYRDM